MADITLHAEPHWDSPYVFTVVVALREKNLVYDEVILDLSAGAQRATAYADATLTARVPAIRHGDFWLSESLAIVEYLDDTFPDPQHARLLPADRHARARARQLLGWLRSDLPHLRRERSTESMFYEQARATAALTPPAAADAAKLIRITEQLLTTRPSTWSIADTDLAFALHRLILNGDPLPAHVRTFAEREWQRPSVRAFVDHARAPLTR